MILLNDERADTQLPGPALEFSCDRAALSGGPEQGLAFQGWFECDFGHILRG